MSEFKTFFRHCPSCGRRFEIRLVKKEELGNVSGDRSTEGFEVDRLASGAQDIGFVTLTDKKVNRFEETYEFRYSYKCQHCDHEWSEERLTKKESRAGAEYSGD